ncbi:MAG: ATPase, T2SS/T4P/T4SS family [Oscillospiraceae bacterium]
MKDNKILEILRLFTYETNQKLLNINDNLFNDIVEIRVRINKEIEIITKNEDFFIEDSIISQNQLNSFIAKCCGYSVYSYEKDIENGYITLKGGHRLGLVGRYVEKEKSDYSIRDISSINIRINKEVLNSGIFIYEQILKDKDTNLLICGPPLSGKTTILRDISRLLSDFKNKKVSVIDERDEIANTVNGQQQNYVGKKTDVLSNYPKNIGLLTAIRTMSPDYIICDEIGQYDDIESLKYCTNCGSNIICTIHSGNDDMKDLRSAIKKCIENKIFTYLVFLDNKNIGTIKNIVKVM